MLWGTFSILMYVQVLKRSSSEWQLISVTFCFREGILNLFHVGQSLEYKAFTSTLCSVSISSICREDPTQVSWNNYTLRSYSPEWAFGLSWGLFVGMSPGYLSFVTLTWPQMTWFHLFRVEVFQFCLKCFRMSWLTEPWTVSGRKKFSCALLVSSGWSNN